MNYGIRFGTPFNDEAGRAVTQCADGEQPPRALGRYPHDAALINIRLPKLDSLHIAQKFRNELNDETRARLIAITAQSAWQNQLA